MEPKRLCFRSNAEKSRARTPARRVGHEQIVCETDLTSRDPFVKQTLCDSHYIQGSALDL